MSDLGRLLLLLQDPIYAAGAAVWAGLFIAAFWDMRKLPPRGPLLPIEHRRYVGMTDTHDTGSWSLLTVRQQVATRELKVDVNAFEDCA